MMEYGVSVGFGERSHIRKALHEAVVIGNDRVDLSLLQHDFRYPHPVRRALLLPRQVFAAVLVEPDEQRRTEGIGGHEAVVRVNCACE